MPLTRTEYLLVKLAEESGEVATIAAKCIEFTLPEVRPDQDKTNARRLLEEVLDFTTIYNMLSEDVGDLLLCMSPEEIEQHTKTKREKVERYYGFSGSLGVVDGAQKDPYAPHPMLAEMAEKADKLRKKPTLTIPLVLGKSGVVLHIAVCGTREAAVASMAGYCRTWWNSYLKGLSTPTRDEDVIAGYFAERGLYEWHSYQYVTQED